MIERSKDDLAAVLRFIRERVCAYSGKPGHRCDCKYGATAESVGRRSESGSGCPELLAAADILEALTPAEEKRVLARIRRHVRSIVEAREIEAGVPRKVIQHRLLMRSVRGAVHVKGAEVRTARALDPLFGSLRDDGALAQGRNADGERWIFTVAVGVSL